MHRRALAAASLFDSASACQQRVQRRDDDRFLPSILGRYFLKSELETSSRFFEYTWRMFGENVVSVSVVDMGAIPE